MSSQLTYPFDGKDLTEADLLAVDEPRLRAEQVKIMAEQAEGLWDKWEAESPEGEARVAARIRTGIAITAILRRTNTGPAKAGKGRKKVDLQAIEAELLE